MKFLIALLVSLSATTAFSEELYFYNCRADREDIVSKGPMNSEEAAESLREFDLDPQSPKALFESLSQEGFHLALLNNELVVTVGKSAYETSTDPAKEMTFPYSCFFGYLYEVSLGAGSWAAAVDAHYKIPATDSLTEIK